MRLIPRSWTQPVFRLKQVVRRARAASWAGALRQHGVEIIGVTGSHGKSTTTALLGSILSDAASVAVGVTRNHANDAVRTLARARPGLDQFVVQEVGFSEPGSVAESARLLGPTVAIVTAIGGDHRKAVGGSRERMAAEKATLVQALRPGGLVVLNADDPLVAAMADLTSCRVVTFGRSGKATLRLLDASSRWPDRLTMRFAYKGQERSIATRFVSDVSALSVMAATLTALELGIDPASCERAIGGFEPLFNKMSVHRGHKGEWYVLDAAKGSFGGIDACLGFLATARAPRKTVLFGTISDHAGASRSAYHRVTRAALAQAERVFVAGPNALRPRRLARSEFPGRIFMEEDREKCVAALVGSVIEDELIYVKSSTVDDLQGALAAAFVDRP